MTTITKDRGCTDILGLLAFLASWGLVAFILLEAKDLGGDPNKIIRGTNGFGEMCGIDSKVKHLPLAAFAYPGFLSSLDWWKVIVCVKDCSETSYSEKMSLPHTSSQVGFYCVPSVTKEGINVTISGSPNADFSTYFKELQRAV